MAIELQKNKIILAGGTIVAAASIGLIMQTFDSGPKLGAQQDGPVSLEVEDVKLTSSALIETPLTRPAPVGATTDGVTPVAQNVTEPGQSAAETAVTAACDITMVASSARAAMVYLDLDASCLPNESFVLHHNGMMFSATTDATGIAQLTVPALSQQAVFIAAFANGEGAVVRHEVPELSDYGRVVLQWRGDATLELHAREYEAAYFSAGHIHTQASGSVAGVERGVSGVLQSFGDVAGPEALRAEVYTYPVSKAITSGRIDMSVEAEVTESNCSIDVEAQTLQVDTDGAIKVRDVTLYMPECDALGDFLVLNNLVEDMTLAAR